MQLFHGLGMEKLKQVTQSGAVIPQGSAGAGKGPRGEQENLEGYTFFATTIEKAGEYSFFYAAKNDVYCILEVDIPEDKLLADDNDCPECATWNESADSIQQVKVEGSVESSHFVKVHFLDWDADSVVYSCDFNNWQQDFAQNKPEMYFNHLDQEVILAEFKSFKRLIKKSS